MLDENTIGALESGAKPRKLFDAKGLYLLVTPGGGRLWHSSTDFRPERRATRSRRSRWARIPTYRWSGRARRDAARRDVANGINPSLRRTCVKICVGNTFQAVAREFIGVLRAANIPAETASCAATALIERAFASPSHRTVGSGTPILWSARNAANASKFADRGGRHNECPRGQQRFACDCRGEA
jgi:hypothetical protein